MRNLHSENRGMLMNTQGAKSISSCIDGRNRIIHPEIPELDLTIPAAGDQLSHAPSLHVHVGDPLLMLTPDLDHCSCGFEALIKDTNGAISEARNEYIPGNLIGGQRSDTRARTCRDVLDRVRKLFAH